MKAWMPVPRAIGVVIALTLLTPPHAVHGSEQRIHPLTFTTQTLPGSDVPGACGFEDEWCFAAMMDVGPDGKTYVVADRGASAYSCCSESVVTLWRSRTDGTFEAPKRLPFLHPFVHLGVTNAGSDVAVDRRGWVYVSSPWENFGASSTMFVSKDRGDTWTAVPVHRYDPVHRSGGIVYSPADDALFESVNTIKSLVMTRTGLRGNPDPLEGAVAEREVTIALNDDLFETCRAGCLPPDEIAGMPVRKFPSWGGWIGRPAVAPSDGTVYQPFSYHVEGKGVAVATSTDEGLTWRYSYIPGSGRGASQHVNHPFPVASVDTAGNVYVAWSEHVAGEGTWGEVMRQVVRLAVSTDQGRSWRGPFDIGTTRSATSVLPAIQAGSDGRIAMAWYGTQEMEDASWISSSWDLVLATSTDATSATPSFDTTVVEAGVHRGPIPWHGGALGNGVTLDLDPTTGAVKALYTRLDTAGRSMLRVATQADGCDITRPGGYIGPGVPADPGTPPTKC